MARRCVSGARGSRFVCCKCLQENKVGAGIVRLHGKREKYHIKDLYCRNCLETTKSMEIRPNDFYEEIIDEAKYAHEVYYGELVLA